MYWYLFGKKKKEDIHVYLSVGCMIIDKPFKNSLFYLILAKTLEKEQHFLQIDLQFRSAKFSLLIPV